MDQQHSPFRLAWLLLSPRLWLCLGLGLCRLLFLQAAQQSFCRSLVTRNVKEYNCCRCIETPWWYIRSLTVLKSNLYQALWWLKLIQLILLIVHGWLQTRLGFLKPFALLIIDTKHPVIGCIVCDTSSHHALNGAIELLHWGGMMQQLINKLISILEMLQAHRKLSCFSSFFQNVFHDFLCSPELIEVCRFMKFKGGKLGLERSKENRVERQTWVLQGRKVNWSLKPHLS